MQSPDDRYKLKEKSNIELHEWVAAYKPGTDEYLAGIQESMRRVANLEELIEKGEAPCQET